MQALFREATITNIEDQEGGLELAGIWILIIIPYDSNEEWSLEINIV